MKKVTRCTLYLFLISFFSLSLPQQLVATDDLSRDEITEQEQVVEQQIDQDEEDLEQTEQEKSKKKKKRRKRKKKKPVAQKSRWFRWWHEASIAKRLAIITAAIAVVGTGAMIPVMLRQPRDRQRSGNGGIRRRRIPLDRLMAHDEDERRELLFLIFQKRVFDRDTKKIINQSYPRLLNALLEKDGSNLIKTAEEIVSELEKSPNPQIAKKNIEKFYQELQLLYGVRKHQGF